MTMEVDITEVTFASDERPGLRVRWNGAEVVELQRWDGFHAYRTVDTETYGVPIRMEDAVLYARQMLHKARA